MRPIKYGLHSYSEHVYMGLCLRPAAPGANFGGWKLITTFLKISKIFEKSNFLSRRLKFLWEVIGVYVPAEKKNQTNPTSASVCSSFKAN